MNEKSGTAGERRMTVHLGQKQLNNWFIANNGREYSPKEKPLDIPVHRAERLVWIRVHHNKLTNPFIVVAHLDEKFFYTANRRRKIKKLPLGKLETPGDENVIMPKMLSRRFPIKAMFMGVVGCPIPHRNFDGKILLEIVSEKVVVSNLSCHQNFTDDVILNQAIKMENGERYLKRTHLY